MATRPHHGRETEMMFDVANPEVSTEVRSIREEVLSLVRMQDPEADWAAVNELTHRLYTTDGLLQPNVAQVLRTYPEAAEGMDKYDDLALDVDSRIAGLVDAADEVRMTHPELREPKYVSAISGFFTGYRTSLADTRTVLLASRLRGRQAGISTGRAHMDLAPMVEGPKAVRNLQVLYSATFRALFPEPAPAPQSAPKIGVDSKK